MCVGIALKSRCIQLKFNQASYILYHFIYTHFDVERAETL